ncbi:MAG: type II/IV secretion system ATPase subunit [Candidatus Bathyarchaeota archaeon]|nr:type II/IV secretion system ATPase subunit [Candidatus Bathyarchaeum tardum]
MDREDKTKRSPSEKELEASKITKGNFKNIANFMLQLKNRLNLTPKKNIVKSKFYKRKSSKIVASIEADNNLAIQEGTNQDDVVEQYVLKEPFVFVKIVKEKQRGNLLYKIEEPSLNENETLALARLKRILNEVIELKPDEMNSKENAETYLKKLAADILNNYHFKISEEQKEKLLYYIVRDNLGFGKIDPLMQDDLIEDISCDGVNVPLYIWHRQYESIVTNLKFDNIPELDLIALRLAYMCGSHVSIAHPLLDASLPDGSRINLTFGTEITRKGSTFTIRKFKEDPFTISDLIDFGTLSKEMAAYLWYAIENRISILVAGGIAAGKTTLLNCLSMLIKPDLKVVSIEDTPELNLPHENWIPAATRTIFGNKESEEITLFDLLKASLRQRPDYIIVGEIRGEEAYTLFQAVSTGHLGMSTIHAESAESAVYRLESAPMNIPRTLIAGIDIILVQKKVEFKGKPVRKTVAATEIVGLDPRSGEILTNETYQWNPVEDTFDFTGRSYILENIAEKKGIKIEQIQEELQNRAKLIEWMQKNHIRRHRDVSDIIRYYISKPEFFKNEVLKNE